MNAFTQTRLFMRRERKATASALESIVGEEDTRELLRLSEEIPNEEPFPRHRPNTLEAAERLLESNDAGHDLSTLTWKALQTSLGSAT